MRMREAAEQVLFARTLEEKLCLPPVVVDDTDPGKALATPQAPGRPPELRVVPTGVRADFPGVNRLDQDRERGRMMHFLANHELLAAELMALVLLKFPDAPREYRAGVYEAMREEQMHTLMYLRRMKECGVAFGEMPVNDYFWRLVSPMKSPMEFVTRLNLTFEQANLDFSKHYAGLFREVGDAATAGVLEKIYHDEIGHVGHGVKWFRHWKRGDRSDWEEFQSFMVFPFAAAKAKGLAPFNAEGRRLAGLDEDFIRQLEVSEQSRGRTPVLHCFHPFAEEEVAAAQRGQAFAPRAKAAALESDGEMVMLGWCRRDDILMMRRPPRPEHLVSLQRAGFDLPEIRTEGDLDGRKLGGMRPWAWTPAVSARWQCWSDHVSSRVAWPWREPLPAAWLSKEAGIRLMEELGLEERPNLHRDPASAMEELAARLEQGTLLLKGLHSCAGRSHLRLDPDQLDSAGPWVKRIIESHGGLVIEPWHQRVCDFSMLYECEGGGVRWMGGSVMDNDSRGAYLGSRVAPKWTSLLDPGISAWLHRQADIVEWIEDKWPRALERLLPGYRGPVGIDCLVHRQSDGNLAWRPVVELNVRMTMGRVALELMRKSRPGSSGSLRFLRKAEHPQPPGGGSLEGGVVLLNDPAQAREFYVVWQVDEPGKRLREP